MSEHEFGVRTCVERCGGAAREHLGETDPLVSGGNRASAGRFAAICEAVTRRARTGQERLGEPPSRQAAPEGRRRRDGLSDAESGVRASASSPFPSRGGSVAKSPVLFGKLPAVATGGLRRPASRGQPESPGPPRSNASSTSQACQPRTRSHRLRDAGRGCPQGGGKWRAAREAGRGLAAQTQ